MALPLPVPPGVVRAVRLGNDTRLAPAAAGWNLDELRGRLIEISGLGDSSSLTQAFGVVLDAQRQEEPVAWLTRAESAFFPVDAWCSGVDLAALVVVRLPDEDAILRATDRLARSGGFGLLIADLGSGSDKATALGRAQPPHVPMASQARLRSLAHRHDLAVVFLTRKTNKQPSIGSMVSLRAEASRTRNSDGFFSCALNVLKDKHRGPGWAHDELVRGPDGL
jgi:recombination protein RecA